MNILFICTMGKQRSRTAADLYSNKYKTDYAGMFSDFNPVTKEKIDKADTLVFMEEEHRIEFESLYPEEYKNKKVLVLNIPDIYLYDDPELKEVLKNKLNTHSI